MRYAVDYVLGAETRVIVVSDETHDDAYAQARTILSSTYRSAAIVGTARPATQEDVERSSSGSGMISLTAMIDRARPSAPTKRQKNRVPCPGCIKRGVKEPNLVRPGYQCNTCADIEEGAY